MISGVINPPCFNVLNKKIIVRHLMATSLGYFFRKNPEYFKSLDALIIHGGGIDEFNKYMQSNQLILMKILIKRILPEPVYANYKDFKWLDEMEGDDDKMTHFVKNNSRND